MGWMGKLVGGTIGFVLGGPLGAIAGAAFGHAIDKNNFQSRPRVSSYTSQYKAQMTFFVGAFSMLARLVQADGRVTTSEISSIKKIMGQDLHLDPSSRDTAMQIFNSALNSTESFDRFALQFYNEFFNQPQILELMLEILMKVAVADGNLGRNEEALIIKAVHIFNFGDSRYQVLKTRYVKDDERFYAVLGIHSGASIDEIKKAYRKQVSEYHPDKIAAKGLPEEFNKFAANKFREIQEAYENIRKAKGF